MVERQIKNSSEFGVQSSEYSELCTQNSELNKNAVRDTQYEQLIQEVKEIYDWLNSQIKNNIPEKCDTCGQCCDFITYDHRLYVTTPEVIFLAANLNVDNLKPMQTGVCPYNEEGKCTVHQYRFAGCRIFNCKANTDIQSELSEKILVKLKSLCTKYQIPYRYMDLASALNEKPYI